jgi:hypothetical protein
MDGRLKRIPALAAAKCLREMDTSDIGGLIAGALALRTVLAEQNATLTDMGRWIEGWDRFERQLQETMPAAAQGIVEWAMRIQLNPEDDDNESKSDT